MSWVNMVWLIFFVISSSALKFTNDEACLSLAVKLSKIKKSEIDEYCNKNPKINKQSFTEKFIEENFYYCLKKITNPEVFFFSEGKFPRFEYIGHLIKQEITSYSTNAELLLSEKFAEKLKSFREKTDL